MFGQQNGIRLGAPFGFPLHVNRLLLIILGVAFLWALASAGEQVWYMIFLLAVIPSVYAHELGHAFATRRLGGHVERIVLHFFGGLTYTSGVRTHRGSIIVSLAGPGVSIALGLVSLFILQRVYGANEVAVLILSALVWVNLVWGVFNLFPIFPLDGGNVLMVLLSRRMTPAKALRTSALVSFVAIGATLLLVVSLGFVDPLFMALLLMSLGWINVQRWQQAAQVGERFTQVSQSLGLDPRAESFKPRRGSSGRETHTPPVILPMPTRRPRRQSGGGGALREHAEDDERMRRVLRRGVKVGFGGLDPRQRRLLLFHRNMLEERLARRGFEKLSPVERELLALHHEMEDRSAH